MLTENSIMLSIAVFSFERNAKEVLFVSVYNNSSLWKNNKLITSITTDQMDMIVPLPFMNKNQSVQ